MTTVADTKAALAALFQSVEFAAHMLLQVEQSGLLGDGGLTLQAVEARRRLEAGMALVTEIADRPAYHGF